MSNEERPGEPSPPADDVPGPLTGIVTKRPPMPASVKTAAVVLGMVFGVCLLKVAGSMMHAAAPAAVIQSMLTGLLLAGTLKGHRLAWQWGRILTILVLLPLYIPEILAECPKEPPGFPPMAFLAFVLAFSAAELLVIFLASGRPLGQSLFLG